MDVAKLTTMRLKKDREICGSPLRTRAKVNRKERHISAGRNDFEDDMDSRWSLFLDEWIPMAHTYILETT